ncbi:MAG: hypothetical protein BroJett029_26990 [Alphaproteobacteria bacterium]|nr:MAG: hypothetical protein BroJett029_26990 [Alphaproteobacteria bacterium]
MQTHGPMDRQQPQEVALARILARHYERHAIHLRSSEAVRHSLNRWNEFFKAAVISEVTLERQREFIAAMRAEGLSDGYIRRVLADGKSALNRAQREGEIVAAPYVMLINESDPPERVATIEEMAWLFRAAKHDHERMYLLLAIGTLARPEAIVQLTTFQVDIEPRLIRLNPPGRRQTKKRRPTIPICDTLLPYLEDAPVGHLVAWVPQPPKGLQPRKRPTPRPIKAIRTTFNRMKARAARAMRKDAAAAARRLRSAGDREGAWEALRDARARAAALMELTPYTLRHTMATELRRRGVPSWEVAGFLGHSSGYRTTERYAKYGADHLSAAVRAIDSYFADLGAVLGGLPRLENKTGPERASSVLPGRFRRAQTLDFMVEPSGIEPLTSTMPL